MRAKVRLADNIARVIFIETDATVGATLGTDLYTPDGAVGTPATVRAWLGVSTTTQPGGGGGGGGINDHRLLLGLTIGNDHPQYTRRDTLTALGDLYVRDASTVTRLPIGAEGYGLKVVGGVPAWALGGTGVVETIVPGFAILVDDYDPANPIVSIDPTVFAPVAFTGDYADLYGAPPDLSGLTFVTENDETALIPNSRRLVASTNITFDLTTPGEFRISATGGGGSGTVDSIVPGFGILVDDYDPANPIVSVDPTAFAPVAFTGDYDDLYGTPTIPPDISGEPFVVHSATALPGALVLTAGTNVTLTPGAGTLTVAASGSGGGGYPEALGYAGIF